MFKVYNFVGEITGRIFSHQVLSPIKDGIVSDWDLVDNIWEHAFK